MVPITEIKALHESRPSSASIAAVGTAAERDLHHGEVLTVGWEGLKGGGGGKGGRVLVFHSERKSW